MSSPCSRTKNMDVREEDIGLVGGILCISWLSLSHWVEDMLESNFTIRAMSMRWRMMPTRDKPRGTGMRYDLHVHTTLSFPSLVQPLPC